MVVDMDATAEGGGIVPSVSAEVQENNDVA